MHEIPLLINTALALIAALIGGMIAKFLRLPTIVGYMVAGIAIGPFTPGYIGDVSTISQLAELGVIFLMFGVGLHFSLGDLWKVRNIAIPGAIGQMLVTTLLGYGLATFFGWSHSSALVLGLAISISSTVVLLRGLMENGVLNTAEGQAAVGWLIFQDIATVLILLLMPAVASGGGNVDWGQLGLTFLKAAAFFATLVFVGRKLIPWILAATARTGSRELFILAVFAVSAGIALASTKIFDVSIALGAFAAGVVVSESKLSHQVSADVLPFRDAFSVLFFVSIGMLVDINYIGGNIIKLIALVAVITIGKYFATLLMGLFIKQPARTFLISAAGLSQIGEFSFILGQAGLVLGMLGQDQYSMILAGALLSIAVNPLMFRTTKPAEKLLRRFPSLWKALDKHGDQIEFPDSIADHVVVIGYGRVGHHIVNVLTNLNIPIVVIDSNVERIEELAELGIPSLYGDAGNTEVLSHVKLENARLLVATTPDDATTSMIVSTARASSPDLHIIARAATDISVENLYSLGANYVIQPELEGGLQVVRRTLLDLGYSLKKVQQYTDAVRTDRYNTAIDTKDERRFLNELLMAGDAMSLDWLTVENGNSLIGKPLADSKMRERSGASIVAISRPDGLISNPSPQTRLKAGDVLGMIGDDEQLKKAAELVQKNA